MPLHDVGYRPWHGERNAPQAAIVVIALTGIRLAWTNRWLRRMVFFTWSPALVFAMSFFAFEQAIDDGRLPAMREAAQAGRNLDGVGMLGTVLADTLGGRRQPSQQVAPSPARDPRIDVAETRRVVWSRLLVAFMRVPQAVLLAIIVGLVAPTLVSRDLRAKAWLVYFTRPVGRLEYILGKCLILGVLVAAITVLPALALWFTGVLVSPSVWVAVDTWDLPLKVIVASIVLSVPTVLLALAFSAVTSESRIASFAWFATWAACWIAHSTLTTADAVAAVQRSESVAAGAAAQPNRLGGWEEDPFDDPEEQVAAAPPRGPGRARPPTRRSRFSWLVKAAGIDPAVDRWAWLSPYHALGVLQAWVFGIENRPRAIVPCIVSLGAMSCIAVLVLLDRIAAPSRV